MKLKKQITEIRNLELKKLIGWDIQKFATSHTIYENSVIENQVKDFMNTHLDHNPFFTVDDSLVEKAGMKKIVNVYNATGKVRDVAKGEGNTEEDKIKVGYEPLEYVVTYTQGFFDYYDEDLAADPMLLDVGLEKMAANMTNDLTSKFYRELNKATLTAEYPTTGINFDCIVDALTLFGEDEEGIFLLINPTQKAQLRRNLKTDLSYSEGFVRNAYVGTVAGIPVYCSKEVPEDTAYLATNKAVTVFVKKGVETEQERDANTRYNKLFNRRCNVVALTDKTKAVKLTKAAPKSQAS